MERGSLNLKIKEIGEQSSGALKDKRVNKPVVAANKKSEKQ